MDAGQLQELEKLCTTMYSGATSNLIDTLEAQRQLMRLQSSAQYLEVLQHALELSSNQFCRLFASKGILVVLTNDWRNVSHSQRLQLQQFLLRMLLKLVHDPNRPITNSVVHALCRLTKQGWCSDPQLRELMDKVLEFLKSGVAHAVLASRILSELVNEFELGRTETGGHLDPEGRLVAQAFREQDGLTRAFLMSLDTVNRAFNSRNPAQDRPVLKEALNTLQTCLAYDFVGTGYSESDDVVACLYIPIEWTKHIATANALRTLFRIYEAQWPPGVPASEVDISEEGPASMCLQCIALVSSTRRSVFDDNTRQEFLVALLEGTTMLIEKKTGLRESESCMHHLCRVLSRIKSHFQLVELSSLPQYHTWLHNLCNLTEEALNAWRVVSSRSVHYLIRLWGALVLPTPYLRMRDGLPSRSGQDGSDSDRSSGGVGGGALTNAGAAGSQPAYLRGLDDFVPRVVEVFIKTRCDMCSAAAVEELFEGIMPTGGGHGPPALAEALARVQNSGYAGFGYGPNGDAESCIEDNPLDDEGMLLEQLTPMSLLARYRYVQSANVIMELFAAAMNERNNAIQQQPSPEGKLRLADAQARLGLLTYLIGAVIGGHVTRVSARAIERLEELNARLAALVFKMVMDSQQKEDMIQKHGQNPALLIFGYGSNAGWHLELATLYFFRCFQTLYVESRAREDEMEKRGRSRAVELVEDSSGFLSFSLLRRGGGAGGAPVGSSGAMVTAGPGGSMFPMFQLRALPSNQPGLDALSRHPLVRQNRGSSASNNDDDGMPGDDFAPAHNPGTPSGGGHKGDTPCSSPIVVDELSAAELAKREAAVNEEANQRAAVMQRSIAHLVDLPGGDRALLDIAMRRVFGLLQYAQQNIGTAELHGQHPARQDDLDESSAPVVLVQRALSVLYQLSLGVTIVHAGRSSKPRLVSSGRLLLESEVICDLLRDPSAERFPLLREPRHGRARSFLLATLSKLLFTQIRYSSSSDLGGVPEDMFDVNAGVLASQDKMDERFIAFIKPMTEICDGLLRICHQSGPMEMRRPELRQAVIGLFRDLRGILSSATAAREYELVFAWFFPGRVQLLSAAAQVWNNDQQVMVPLLKLLSELVHNRGSRIVFPTLSAGGLILFREASKVLVAYCQPQLAKLEQTRHEQRGTYEQRELIKKKLANTSTNLSTSLRHMLVGEGGTDNPDPMSMQALQEAVKEFFSQSTDADDEKKAHGKDGSMPSAVDLGPGAVGPGITVNQEASQSKCARVSLVVLGRMLSGSYALLGTFQLFGDTSLLDARRLVLELSLAGSPQHVMSFPKMAKALTNLLSMLAEQFILSLIDLSSPLFARIMGCLGEALVSSQSVLSTPAARTIEAIAVFRCKALAAVYERTPQQPVPNGTTGEWDSNDTAQRIRAVLNPEHRSRGDTTPLSDYAKAAQLFQMHEQAHPNLFGSLLGLIMNTLFATPFSDSPGQWSLAKPVMPLVLCAPQEFERQRAEFLNAQNAAREPRIRDAYDSLFSKLAPGLNNPSYFNVLLRNNENFSKQLCFFCRDIRRD